MGRSRRSGVPAAPLVADDAPVDVRHEDGWYGAYVNGRRVARLGDPEHAAAVCRRMSTPKGRMPKAQFVFVSSRGNDRGERQDPKSS